jgi:hypothetical protein
MRVLDLLLGRLSRPMKRAGSKTVRGSAYRCLVWML